ncbi:MAG TPA: energy transducer TonB [Gallionella sp.]|nr:energy transducer TonB [Gallionella sp.]
MTAVAMNRTDPFPAAALSERVIVIALVVAVHLGLASAWMMQPERARVAVSEMSVSVAIRQAEVAQAQAQPEPVPPKPRPHSERSEKPVPKQTEQKAPGAVAQQETPVQAAPPAQAAAPSVAAAPVFDTVPDYRASYLNNPRPSYPMVARRMGWEGRVVLNVEVRSAGDCGEVSVFQSSGHEVLDNAALRTVKSWHFVPASRAGHPVTQWFKVPIQFSLKENEV